MRRDKSKEQPARHRIGSRIPGRSAVAAESGDRDVPPGRQVQVPSLSLPKGGGALRSIGEKFSTNPVTGTSSISIPIAASPGRSGFGPQLSLTYDSGAGNGPFGMGWRLSLPSVTRKTDKGLPLYRDGEASDVFILSGAEDLVPCLEEAEAGQWQAQVLPPRSMDGKTYTIQRYRPRIEGLFARIERWTNPADGADSCWRSISRDNITTWYGKTVESRIADPADPSRIFSWLICESYDDKGNAMVYRYAAEDSAHVDLSRIHEANRTAPGRSANRYLKRIQYGNKISRRVQADPGQMEWLFEVVFDYGDGHYQALDPDPLLPEAEQHKLVRAAADSLQQAWPVRPDPFSSYRAGFEVRTYRRCQRVLIFHNFAELGVAPYLVSSTEFHYDDLDYTPSVTLAEALVHPGSTRFASHLRAVTQAGYVHHTHAPIEATDIEQIGATGYVTYIRESLPPLEFEYSKAGIQRQSNSIEADELETLPQGLDGRRYQWVDLDGEGAAGILTQQGGAWFYKRNLSPLPLANDAVQPAARFAPAERVSPVPSFSDLSAGRQQILDLAGDGQVDLVTFKGPVPGFFERDAGGRWQPLRAFASLPNIDWDDPNMRFVDLTGDGQADILITEDEALTWYASRAEDGFASGETVHQAMDEEEGPKLLFADGRQSVYLTDMSGDGLTDLVRIRNGEVCYWPNLGYGRFGAKVTMDNSPRFDAPDQFDNRRIRLADIDGSGVTDMIYLKNNGVFLYFNESGNRWSDAEKLKPFPKVDQLSTVTVVDLFGNGTACLVWSSPLPAAGGNPLRYVDLMGGRKPHLLVGIVNNFGAETRIRYAPSTKFYLQDRQDGNPWITRLHFPVQVVERVETFDRISGNRFVSRYAYHHGYYDGAEREFRGFGMVEQTDSEVYAALGDGAGSPPGSNIDAASHVPPVLTRTWFHTGAYLREAGISLQFKQAYFREPGMTDAEFDAQLLPDTVLPPDLTAEEQRQAARALKGTMLRQELYALDGTNRQQHPYVVTEQNTTIEVLQPQGSNRHAVFFTHARESLNYHYERNPADPRLRHAMTLEVDHFGNVLKQAAIGYGRRQPDMDLPPQDRAKQAQTLITYTENRVTNSIDTDDDHRTPSACETRTYALTGYTPTGQAGRYVFSDFIQSSGSGLSLVFDEEIPYEAQATSGRQRRVIEHGRTVYRPNDLGTSVNDALALLPLGTLESRALTGISYTLAFTPGLIAHTYQRELPNQPVENLLPNPGGLLPADIPGGLTADRGGYVDLDGDGHWWTVSGRIFYSAGQGDTPAHEQAEAAAHFYLPRRQRDPFGAGSVITYDPHDLLMVETRDALGNRVTVGERDLNGNLTLPGIDYRLLQPVRVMDANRNRSAVAYDALGRVVATAAMGKPEENLGDALDGLDTDLTPAAVMAHLAQPLADPHALLGKAGSRLIYDVHAFHRTKAQTDPQPVAACSLVRETHDTDLAQGEKTPVQQSFVYADGLGREIQQKMQAEPGPVPQRDSNGQILLGPDQQPVMTPDDASPRWVSSGWTVFNNKGNPVKQYEPFFSDRHTYDGDVRIGVGAIHFYDPIGRVVANLHADHTWEKIVFDAWRNATWDVNDTVLITDPKTDAEVGDYFSRLPEDAYLPTWHQARSSGQLGPAEQAAAQKTEPHAHTPGIVYTDTLDRTFLTRVDNGAAGSYDTRVALDIEGNQREVTDAGGRIVMQYDYNLLGGLIHQLSMEAGERWMVQDVAGNPIRAWDSRGHAFRSTYDALRRPVGSYVRDQGSPEILFEHSVYGETQSDPESTNLRGQVSQLLDQAGVETFVQYDFKGNLLQSTRRFAQAYRESLNWQSSVPLAAETFVGRTRFDAMNRPVQSVLPHAASSGAGLNIIQTAYNEANLPERVDVWLQQSIEPQALLDPQSADVHAVERIDYDAKGLRTRIDYGNGTTTQYTYDPLTFRLRQLATTRLAFPAAERIVQDLHYTYDPTGNISHIQDDADIQNTVYFNNQRVDPSSDYMYDAVYRLITAKGREHIGPNGVQAPQHSDGPRIDLAHPSDGNAMGRYTESYVYDAVGNIQTLTHHTAGGNWVRQYGYTEASLIEPGKTSNRLSTTTVGGTTLGYAYDAHGSMRQMPHLPLMQWGVEDQLQATQQQAVNAGNGAGERTYYVYDAAGRRVRKTTERETAEGQIPRRKNERFYLGGFEIYRQYNGNGDQVALERETLHIADDTRRIALVETKTIDLLNEASPTRLIRYQFGNHAGSASLELDGQARVISYEEYYPYGSTAYQAVDKSIRAAAKRYRYIGQERDDETGFSYHGLRYYAPWLGRWTAADPAGLADGAALYSYASGNPVVLVDKNGLDSRQYWLGEQTKLWIRAVATVTSRGVSSMERLALKGISHAFGPGTEMHWGHLPGQTHGITMAGQTATMRPEPAEENLGKSHQDKLAKQRHAAAGNPVRDAEGRDPKPQKGRQTNKGRQPTPETRTMADYAEKAGLKKTKLPKARPAPATPAPASAAPAPGVPPEQLSFDFSKPAASKPPAPKPPTPKPPAPKPPAPKPPAPKPPAPKPPAPKALKPSTPKSPKPVKPKGKGKSRGGGAVGAVAWGLVVVDVAQADSPEEKVEVMANAAEGMVIFSIASKAPLLGRVMPQVGAGMVGWELGTRGGNYIAEEWMTDEQNEAVGETIVGEHQDWNAEDVVGESAGSWFDENIAMPIGKYIVGD